MKFVILLLLVASATAQYGIPDEDDTPMMQSASPARTELVSAASPAIFRSAYAEPAPMVRTLAYEAPAVRTLAYEAPAVRTIAYEAPAVRTVAYEAPEVRTISYEAPAVRTLAYEAPAIRTVAYEAPATRTVAYETPAVRTLAYEAPAVRTVAYEAPAIRAEQSYGYGAAEVRTHVPIVKYNMETDNYGTYNMDFQTADGTSQSESGALKFGSPEGPVNVKKGSYSYVVDGQTFRVDYIADETGFHAFGAHLPTPPPVPAEIADSISSAAYAVAPLPVTRLAQSYY